MERGMMASLLLHGLRRRRLTRGVDHAKNGSASLGLIKGNVLIVEPFLLVFMILTPREPMMVGVIGMRTTPRGLTKSATRIYIRLLHGYAFSGRGGGIGLVEEVDHLISVLSNPGGMPLTFPCDTHATPGLLGDAWGEVHVGLGHAV